MLGRLALPILFVTVLFMLAGCHNASDSTPGSVAPAALLVQTSDQPGPLPPTAAVFAAVAIPKPLNHNAQPALPPSGKEKAAQTVQLAKQAATAPSTPATLQSNHTGLIVCPPTATESDQKDFASGCSRWLHLIAAGQPELGCSPLWTSLSRATKEINGSGMGLTPDQYLTLTQTLGATHAAIGTITGSPGHCTLTYRLMTISDHAVVGQPISVTGSQAQIIAALPSVARTLDQRLGVSTPSIPNSAGLTPSELIWLGGLPDWPQSSDSDLLTLSQLSKRSPLAGMLLLNTRADRDRVILNRTAETLQTQLPGNALVLSHLCYIDASVLRPHTAAVTSLVRRYQGNALMSHVDAWIQRGWGDRRSEWQAEQRIVRDAPQSADAWLSMAWTLGELGQDLRKCRTVNLIKAQEWGYLNQVYGRWEATTRQATRLEPRWGHAWRELAEASTFAGDSATADAALWKALPLALDRSEVYSWGLEMYQPKWGGDASKLNLIAQKAADDTYVDAGTATEIAGQLAAGGFDAYAQEVITHDLVRTHEEVRQHPDWASSHWELANDLAYSDKSPDLRTATAEYRAAAHLMPDSALIHDALGNLLDKRGHNQEAIPEFEQAVSLDPMNSTDHYDLAYDYKHERRLAEADREFRAAIELNPANPDPHYGLGETLQMAGHIKLAIKEYQEAVRLAPYFIEALKNLCWALDADGQYAAVIATGQQTVNLVPNADVYDNMADAKIHLKRFEASIQDSNEALSLNSSDAIAHENLGEAYIGQGKRELAHTEWQKTMTMGNPPVTAMAQKMLAKYP